MQLVFEAQRGVGELSDIAIDDIYFDNKRCPLADQGRTTLQYCVTDRAFQDDLIKHHYLR